MHGADWALIGGLLALAAARPSWRSAAVAVAIAAGFGVSDEWHQSYVPGRDASWLDLVADTVGAVAGACAVTWYIARKWRSSTASAASGPPSPTTSSWPTSPP
jgi:VanZ family protein